MTHDSDSDTGFRDDLPDTVLDIIADEPDTERDIAVACDIIADALTCPFCGSDNLELQPDATPQPQYVRCIDCDAFGPTAPRIVGATVSRAEMAVNLWNARVS